MEYYTVSAVEDQQALKLPDLITTYNDCYSKLSEAIEAIDKLNIDKIKKDIDKAHKFIDRLTKFRNSFFIQKAFKQNWIKNKTKEGGALHHTIKLQKKDEIVLASHTKKYGKMYSHVKPENLNALVAKQNGLYEVINKFPYKVYFDLDIKIDSSNTIDNESYLNNVAMAVMVLTNKSI